MLVPARAWTAQVWHERGLGSVTVGYDPESKRYVHRKFYLDSFGPDDAVVPDAVHVRDCMAWATTETANPLRDALAKLEPLPDLDGADAKALKAQTDAATQRDHVVTGLINDAIKSFRTRITTAPQCKAVHTSAAEYQLGMIQRVCDSRYKSCTNEPLAYATHPQARAFTALSYWIDARDPHHQTLPPNMPVLFPGKVGVETKLDRLAAKAPVAALAECRARVAKGIKDSEQLPLTCLTLEMASRPFDEANLWANPPEPKAAQALFEHLVVKAREADERVEQNVPRVVAIPYQIAVRVLDVVDQPLQAILDLRADPKATLLSIQDEMARTRITECSRFQGIQDLNRLSKCAGFSVDSTALGACLSGKECRPAMLDKASPSALLILRPTDAAELATSNILPRVGIDPTKFSASMDKCAKANHKSREDAARCLIGELPPQQSKAWSCLHSIPPKTEIQMVECTTGKKVPPEAEQMMECYRDNPNAKSRLRCVAEANMPPEMRDYVECKEKHPKDNKALMACIAEKKLAGKTPKDFAECWATANGDKEKAAGCYVAKHLPKEARDYADCLQQSDGDGNKALACGAGKKAPKKYQDAAICYAQSSSMLSMGLCMASKRADMTEDQRIAVECAVTAKDGITYVGCVGGRMAAKFFINCIDKDVFVEGCMGKSNELVKAFDAIGIKLTPKSPIGRVVNAQWDTVKFQVASYKAAGKGVEHFAKETEEELGKAERSVRHTRQKFARERDRVRHQADVNYKHAVEWVKNKVGKLRV